MWEVAWFVIFREKKTNIRFNPNLRLSNQFLRIKYSKMISLDKSPVHILFSICPYRGSSLKRCSLLSMITTFMLFSQTPLDKLENKSSFLLLQTGSSWRKSPENIMENPPKIWVLFPMSLSFLSSSFRTLLLMNDISSIKRIRTSSNSFLSSWLRGLRWLMKVRWTRRAKTQTVQWPEMNAWQNSTALSKIVCRFLYTQPTDPLVMLRFPRLFYYKIIRDDIIAYR